MSLHSATHSARSPDSTTHQTEQVTAEDGRRIARGYDYVVVGGGTAGCVLANRLTEDPAVHVLLVEAGSATDLPAMSTPGVWPTLLGTEASWGDTTVPQAFSHTVIPAPRGRALGGSSSINGLNFLRGHRSSYDAWVDQGATGWGFDDLLPYFRRSETTEGRDPAIRGTTGPLLVGPTLHPSPAVVGALAAAAEAGFALVDDVNSGLETGFGLSDANVTDGARQSAADAYLRPVMNRHNLKVLTGAEVRRLLIVDGACTGIEYSRDGLISTVEAGREVILTAGAIGTPQLLMLSGIGPAEHLSSVGIDVAHHLPGVGNNLHDHPMSTVVYDVSTPLAFDPHNIYGQGVGLVQTDPSADGPDLQILFISQPYRAGNMSGPDNGYAIGFSAVTPSSRGTVRLADSDPATRPLIDPDYLGDEKDVAVMTEGLRIARLIGSRDALAQVRGSEAQPGTLVADDAEVRQYLRDSLLVYFHYAGTCRVGTDDLSVVGPDLRVHGISGLRVADASIMPSPVSANTNATVYAIAEKAAALIMSGAASTFASTDRTGFQPTGK
jgi:choline dehydrogenase